MITAFSLLPLTEASILTPKGTLNTLDLIKMLLTIISILIIIVAASLLYTYDEDGTPSPFKLSKAQEKQAEEDAVAYRTPIGESGRLAILAKEGDEQGDPHYWKKVKDIYNAGKTEVPVLGFGPSAKFQRDHPDNPVTEGK